MTPERQAEMQRSLMTMLGDRRHLDNQALASKTRPVSRSIKLSSDVPPPISPDAVIMPPLPPSAEGHASDVNKSNSEKIDARYVSDADLEKWACALCTLLNHHTNECCEACETPRVL